MPVKDYYRVLHVMPDASDEEIKKAYRSLAHKLHPDKNGQSSLSDRFVEIKEAYEILRDAGKRKSYDRYLYGQKKSSRQTGHASSAAELLENVRSLYNKLYASDPSRMDRDVLYFEIARLLSNHNCGLLEKTDDTVLNKEVVTMVLACSRHLPFGEATAVCKKLLAISRADHQIVTHIRSFLETARLQHFWNRYKIPVALAAAIIISICIYLLGK